MCPIPTAEVESERSGCRVTEEGLALFPFTGDGLRSLSASGLSSCGPEEPTARGQGRGEGVTGVRPGIGALLVKGKRGQIWQLVGKGASSAGFWRGISPRSTQRIPNRNGSIGTDKGGDD
jgi:hypothetical protein